MRKQQQLALRFYEQMVLSLDRLTEEEKQELAQFEKKRPTSEWPGWAKYLEREA